MLGPTEILDGNIFQYESDRWCGCCPESMFRCWPIWSFWGASGHCCEKTEDANGVEEYSSRYLVAAGTCWSGIGTTIGYCKSPEQIEALQEDCETKISEALSRMEARCDGTFTEGRKEPEDCSPTEGSHHHGCCCVEGQAQQFKTELDCSNMGGTWYGGDNWCEQTDCSETSTTTTTTTPTHNPLKMRLVFEPLLLRKGAPP